MEPSVRGGYGLSQELQWVLKISRCAADDAKGAPKDLREKLQEVLDSDRPENGSGATDASVRLGSLLKVHPTQD